MKKLILFGLFIVFTDTLTSATQSIIPVKRDTELIKAIKNSDMKTVKHLLKKKRVAVNEFGIDQKTAMDVAVEFGDAKSAILLSKYGGKMTRPDNVAEFRYMLKYRAKRLFISFMVMLLFAPIAIWAFEVCVNLAEHVSAGYLALAIPAGVGIFVYSGYEWSRLFKGFSMYSKIEQNWMIAIPDNLA